MYCLWAFLVFAFLQMTSLKIWNGYWFTRKPVVDYFAQHRAANQNPCDILSLLIFATNYYSVNFLSSVHRRPPSKMKMFTSRILPKCPYKQFAGSVLRWHNSTEPCHKQTKLELSCTGALDPLLIYTIDPEYRENVYTIGWSLAEPRLWINVQKI